MSSDTYHIHVQKIDGDRVEFLCVTGTAAGYNDYSITRSFVLMIIQDGMPYCWDDTKGTPLQLELRKLAGGQTPPVWEQSFHKEHVGKFIKKALLVERIGIITDTAAWSHGRFDLEDEENYPLHRFVLHAQVTDPKWLEGLKEGSRYGTTAFDAWWDDPKKQSRKSLAEIEENASRWYPPGKESPAVAKPAPAKKAAVKKSAAKKTSNVSK